MLEIRAIRDMAIRPRYAFAESFSEGLAVVREGEGLDARKGYINNMGEYVIGPEFVTARPFWQGLAYVATESDGGYIDQTGKWMFRCDVRLIEGG